MFKKYKSLPLSLKVVFWLNIVTLNASIGLLVISILAMQFNEAVSSLFSAVFSLIVIGCVFARWNIIRNIILIFAWLAVLIVTMGFVVSLATVGPGAFLIILPALLSIATPASTIWGFTTIPARRYYGEETPKTEAEIIHDMYDIVGLEVAEAETRLDLKYRYHSVEEFGEKQKYAYQNKSRKNDFLILIVANNIVEEISDEP